MMRVPLQDFPIPIPPSYVESLRAQFMRMFLDFVVGEFLSAPLSPCFSAEVAVNKLDEL